MKEEIINKIRTESWLKVLIVFFIVFLFIFGVGAMSINYLNDVVNNNHIHSDVVTVKDKMYGDNPYSDYYIIVGDNNKTYGITNHDGYGQEMFKNISIGHTYEFVVKEPELTDINQQTHILQVHNDRGKSI